MIKYLLLILFIFPSIANATVRYVRTDGGTATQCTGTTDAAYPGSGSAQACSYRHPFYALGWWSSESNGTYSGGAAGTMVGSDTLIVKPGSYAMGYAPEFTNCSVFNTSRCIARQIPSGVPGSPTKVFGCSSTGCTGAKTTYPELFGVGREFNIFDMTGKSWIELGWFNMTDHATCSEGSNRWNCSSFLNDGVHQTFPWGWDGLTWTGGSNITLRYVWVHGMTRDGLRGSCANCSILGSSHFDFNYSGYNQDTCNNTGTCGSADGTTLNFIGNSPIDLSTIEWNGCVEDPNNIGTPMASGCQNGNNGGYGDGWGASVTGGTWYFQYVSMSHNTADGLDLKYHDNSNDLITVRDSTFVNNAGNDIKTNDNALFIHNILEGNCNFFAGKFYYNADAGGMASCNSLGDAWNVNFSGSGKLARFYGNTVVNVKGNVFVSVVPHGGGCSNNTIEFKNNIIQYTGYAFDGTAHSFLDIDSTCSGIVEFLASNDIVGFSNSSLYAGTNGVTSDPALSGTFDSRFTVPTNMTSSSPARNIVQITPSGQPSVDINGFSRGSLPWDAGALEFGSTFSGTPQTCGDGSVTGTEVCDGSNLNGGTCITQGFTAGTLTCNSNCLGYNTSACTSNLCGNSAINGNEQCDTANLNGQTCQSQGFSSGTLSCAANCTFNTSSCVTAVCGNGTQDAGEQCDDGGTVNGSTCSPTGCSAICEPETCPYELLLNYNKSDVPVYQSNHTQYVNYAGMSRAADSYLRKDFGAAYFTGDFIHDFTMTVDFCNDNGVQGAIAGGWALSSSPRTSIKDMTNNTDGAAFYLYCLSHSAAYQWTLLGGGGASAQTFNDTIPAITRYIRIQRTSGVMTAKIYSDANRTVLLSTLTITDATAYRYFYPILTYNTGNTGTSISGRNSNYNLTTGSTPPPPPTPVTYGTKLSGCTCVGGTVK